MNDIQTHFDILMSPEEQGRIGATPDKSDSMRVMRVLSEYDRMRDALTNIANMPEYDQDDAHRLRHQAQLALVPSA